MKYLLIPLIFLSGVALPLEAAMNAKLKGGLQSPVLSAVFVSLIATAVASLVLLFGLLGRGNVSGASTLPWWAWTGGILGFILVIVGLTALPKVGAEALITVTVLGQVVTALLMDHYGWLDVPQVRINGWRIAGAVLVFVGVLMTTRKG
ncbi:MAG: DMT family transporter [Armatimonadota bacterium]|nr:DMT family transporter [Armatimonadota bacterium]